MAKGNNGLINMDAEDKGLEMIVLAQMCRRELIASVYGNELNSMQDFFNKIYQLNFPFF